MKKLIITALTLALMLIGVSCGAQNNDIGLTVNEPIINGSRIEFSMSADRNTDDMYIITALYDANKVLSSVKVNDLNGYFDAEPNRDYMMKIFAWDKTTLEPKCDSFAFDNLQTTADAAIPQTGYTQAVPEEYTQAASEQGTVVTLEYDSKDYVRDSASIKKTAYVYLPYGYNDNDSETRYDIIYLMHGWGGHAGEYFEFTSQKNMFDNLIENGDMKPTIMVSASFYNENSDTDFSSSIEEFRAFHNDFENNLMPAVEGKYHTYAKSTSDADLKASRDHRAFGGFSLGSVTTWLEFC